MGDGVLAKRSTDLPVTLVSINRPARCAPLAGSKRIVNAVPDGVDLHESARAFPAKRRALTP